MIYQIGRLMQVIDQGLIKAARFMDLPLSFSVLWIAYSYNLCNLLGTFSQEAREGRQESVKNVYTFRYLLIKSRVFGI
jgi:hypothetical protein